MKNTKEYITGRSGNLAEIKHIVAIASGKGGVGKSTLSANLAAALAKNGAKVGLMDADIYGASQPNMLGKTGDVRVEGNLMIPLERHGIRFISMGLLADKERAVIWRAPIAVQMIQHFINSVNWGKLDYLLIDLPPGTGDIQLTLSQSAELSGAVIVSTPQQTALDIAYKGLKMFEQVNVPIVGIIENMSGFTCPHCGNTTHIFDRGGAEELAQKLEIPFLGAIPIDPQIMSSSDEGIPMVFKEPDSPTSKALLKVAEKLRESLDYLEDKLAPLTPIKEEIDPKTGELTVTWKDGHKTKHSPYNLRIACRCAHCVDEHTGEKLLDPSTVPLDIKLLDIKRLGRYAYQLTFSDYHNSGIFTYKRLRNELDENSSKNDSFEV